MIRSISSSVGYDRPSGLEWRRLDFIALYFGRSARDTVTGLLQVEAEISVLVTSKGLGR